MRPTATIIVRYCETAGQWLARFDGAPFVTYGADFSMSAVRRLLEGYHTPAGEFELHVGQDQAGSAVLKQRATWQPPELLLPCSACNGQGQYVGLNEVEICNQCRGQKLMPG